MLYDLREPSDREKYIKFVDKMANDTQCVIVRLYRILEFRELCIRREAMYKCLLDIKNECHFYQSEIDGFESDLREPSNNNYLELVSRIQNDTRELKELKEELEEAQFELKRIDEALSNYSKKQISTILSMSDNVIWAIHDDIYGYQIKHGYENYNHFLARTFNGLDVIDLALPYEIC